MDTLFGKMWKIVGVMLCRWEDRVAMEDAETGEQIRYGQLASKVGFPHPPVSPVPPATACH